MFEKITRTVGRALRKARPGMTRVLYNDPSFRAVTQELAVKSSAFDNDGPIPVRYTADGEKISPPLTWEGIPEGTASVAIVIEDPDSPTPAPFVHAIIWNLTGQDGTLEEGNMIDTRVKMGKNSYLQSAYLPMAPPPGHGMHRYVFQVFALDTPLALTGSPGRGELVSAMRDHVKALGFCVGTYERR